MTIKLQSTTAKALLSGAMIKSVDINDSLVRKEVRKLFRNSLKLRQVSAGGDNSCEMELNAVRQC